MGLRVGVHLRVIAPRVVYRRPSYEMDTSIYLLANAMLELVAVVLT